MINLHAQHTKTIVTVDNDEFVRGIDDVADVTTAYKLLEDMRKRLKRRAYREGSEFRVTVDCCSASVAADIRRSVLSSTAIAKVNVAVRRSDTRWDSVPEDVLEAHDDAVKGAPEGACDPRLP